MRSEKPFLQSPLQKETSSAKPKERETSTTTHVSSKQLLSHTCLQYPDRSKSIQSDIQNESFPIKVRLTTHGQRFMGGLPTANQQYIRPVWNSGLESRIKTRHVHPLPVTHRTRQSARYVQQKRSNRRNLITIPLINSSPNLSTQSNPLTFLLSNTRSLLPKLDDLKIILDQYGVSMAFITETWLNEKIDDAAVCIDGFSLARRD